MWAAHRRGGYPLCLALHWLRIAKPDLIKRDLAADKYPWRLDAVIDRSEGIVLAGEIGVCKLLARRQLVGNFPVGRDRRAMAFFLDHESAGNFGHDLSKLQAVKRWRRDSRWQRLIKGQIKSTLRLG